MWDVFISHASEDKDEIANPLAEALSKAGFKVWHDDLTLKLGDSLNRTINRGLADSKYGIVILSPNFFDKEWPQRELDGLAAQEIRSGKTILPVLHNLSHQQLAKRSPILADKLAVSTNNGVDVVVREIMHVLQEVPGDTTLPQRRKQIPWRTISLVISLFVVSLVGIQGYYYYLEQLHAKARAKLSKLSIEYTQDSFIEAVKRGDKHAVDLFLTAKIDPNAKNDQGATALEKAVIKQDSNMIERLLSAKEIDVNAGNQLSYAVGGRNISIIETLLRAGANVNIGGALTSAAMQDNETILHILLAHDANTATLNDAFVGAAAKKNSKSMRILLNHGADSNKVAGEALREAINPWGYSASDENRHATVTFLIKQGVDVNLKSHLGRTPLHNVSRGGDTSIALALLEAGADVNARCEYNGSIADGWDWSNDHSNTSLRDFSDNATALLLALLWRHYDTAEVLLREGADVNAKNKAGLTALMTIAMAMNHEYDGERNSIAKTLLAKGADVDAKNYENQTALMYAASGTYNGYSLQHYTEPGSINDLNPDMARIFLDAGAKVDYKDSDGHTALMYAAAWNRTEIVKLLLDKGASVNDKDDYGNSVLLIAKYGRHPNFINKKIVAPFQENKNKATIQLLQQVLKENTATAQNNR